MLCRNSGTAIGNTGKGAACSAAQATFVPGAHAASTFSAPKASSASNRSAMGESAYAVTVSATNDAAVGSADLAPSTRASTSSNTIKTTTYAANHNAASKAPDELAAV